jgi:formate hydrogenlyase subunit 6/NADH:ubiquinone oxidoreductase subunit I
VRGLLPVRRRLPGELHLYRGRREHREQRISSSERYAKVYNIDYNRCIFCGYCVEACPTDAITHGHGFELATLNATNLVMRKEDMLVPVSALTASAHRALCWPSTTCKTALAS